MKDIISKSIFIILDVTMVILSLYLASNFRDLLPLPNIHDIPYYTYLSFLPLYIILLSLFIYEGIYSHRYDFWHESRIVIKVIIFSAILVFAYLAMTKSIENYSRLVIGLAFIFMMFFIPLSKNLFKKILYNLGLWRKKASIHGKDTFLTDEIYGNSYLGYIKPKKGEEPSIIFVNSKEEEPRELRKVLATQIKNNHEVIFIPIIDDYDLTHSHIYELSNTRTNLIVYQNRLKSVYRRLLQQIANWTLALILLPFVLILTLIIAIFIKIESKGSIFYIHHRVGYKGKMIPTLKFRSMHHDAKERLATLLASDESKQIEWEETYKIKNDPRVTKVGAFLRKTSLDELPQVFNVLAGQMHIIGPRPVLQEELDKYYKEDTEYYFMVKPGITGLWQVSGRSDTDYKFRVNTDKWYVSNWSLWLDIVILFKTLKVVLGGKGAY